LEKRQI
jgi:hypothetical protein